MLIAKRTKILLSVISILAILPSVKIATADDSAKPQPFIQAQGLCDNPEAMLREKFLSEIDEAKEKWIATYETLKTPEDVANYQKRLRANFKEALGQMWDRSAPLNPQITGTLVKDTYRAENVIFESVPGVYVTGTMFLPLEDKFKGPYPALLVMCGHTLNGKAYELYQGLGILAATNGLASFVVDPIDQGERFQYLKDGKPTIASVAAHNMVHAGSILVGRNCATFEVWDGMRAIDYLQSRDDIIADKIGVSGTSGGGTQTSYMMSLDDRVALAAPSCYICSLFDDLTHNLGPQDGEQNIFGQLKFGMDHADYLFLRAPIPTLMCGATKDFFNIDDGWRSYRYAVRIFSRLGYQNRISIVEKDDEHGYSDIARVATVRWMLRWLAGRDEEITLGDLTLLNDEEIRSIKSGKSVMTLPNALTSRDLNVRFAKELEPARRAKWQDVKPEAAAALVKERALVRNDDARPEAKLVAREKVDDAYDVAYETDENVYLTARENFADDEQFDALTIVIGDAGRNSEYSQKVAAEGGKVACVELRGYGDTQAIGRTYYSHAHFGTDGSDYCLAYLLGKSYVGLRVDDLVALVDSYRKAHGVKTIKLCAEGRAMTVALVAAVAFPSEFDKVALASTPTTWTAQLASEYGPIYMDNAIHGVLYDFDLDDLTGYLAKVGKLAE